MILFITCMVLLIVYWWLIAWYHRAWNKIPEYKIEDSYLPTELISVVVPARNEEAHIDTCIKALLAQQYPKHLFEIIVINDHSTDDTAAIVKRYASQGVQLIQLEEILKNNKGTIAYKKKAIESGIAQAKGTLIVTTDADCSMSPQWLTSIAAYRRQYQSHFMAAPVKINHRNTLLSKFQCLDFAILQGITGASVTTHTHNMCNGANLAYLKEAFYAVNGFKGIDNIASGDDMLLMQKITAQDASKVHYLKSRDAIVNTEPSPNWKTFFQQRIRWASKSGAYREWKIISVLLLVYLLNLGLFLLLAGSIFYSDWWVFFGVAVFYKTLIEWEFVKTMIHYFGEPGLMKFFPFFQPLHIIYTVIAGFLGSISHYEWKGRRVK